MTTLPLLHPTLLLVLYACLALAIPTRGGYNDAALHRRYPHPLDKPSESVIEHSLALETTAASPTGSVPEQMALSTVAILTISLHSAARSPATHLVQPSSTVAALNVIPSSTRQENYIENQHTLPVAVVSLVSASEHTASPTVAPEPHLAYIPAPTTTADGEIDTSMPHRTTLVLAPQLSSAPAMAVATNAAIAKPGSIVTASPAEPLATYLDDPNPSFTDDRAVSASTQRSRQSALLTALLTLGTLAALGTCLLCLRCKLYSRVKRGIRHASLSTPTLEQAIEEGREKMLFAGTNEKGIMPSTQQRAFGHVEEVILPILPMKASAPPGYKSTSEHQLQLPHNGGSPPMQLLAEVNASLHLMSTKGEGPFEDVTHVLSTDAFIALEGPSASCSNDSNVSSSATTGSQESRVPSVSGASYETCESRYSSHPAGSVGDHMSLATSLESPSTPSSDFLHTPGIGEGPFQDQRPIEAQEGKEELVRILAKQLEIESEWDIARAYGARESTASTEADVETQFKVGDMETVEMGGKTCILVQGVAH